ncbi:GNAT family N-acetyltransferase [Shewanella sp. NIFS-20-20]|uniref:GNAT family N-acetyltransferase n=1 Tax=Shewanella sp. NIFS-20-20 TaxID=2853806 RepID=UPI001C4448D2|nr:GNAT family N-acetyltransferase [Shewanella sp. NIFS-20-20]MBV7316542.1 GNAT family N-acetyltransferase [Shewanella sp. NIFS-20-20]
MSIYYHRDTLSIRALDPQRLIALSQLSLAPEQTGFVESVADCLADAQHDHRYVAAALCVDEQVVGFAMYGLFDEQHGPRVWFDRYFIGHRFQGQGLGRAFATLMVHYLLQHYQCQAIYLSVFAENLAAIALYQDLGFCFNGELDYHGEQVMVFHANTHTPQWPITA